MDHKPWSGGEEVYQRQIALARVGRRDIFDLYMRVWTTQMSCMTPLRALAGIYLPNMETLGQQQAKNSLDLQPDFHCYLYHRAPKNVLE